jgi:hypothetical protein
MKEAVSVGLVRIKRRKHNPKDDAYFGNESFKYCPWCGKKKEVVRKEVVRKVLEYK